MFRFLPLALVIVTSTAHAEPQVQADLGLSVIMATYEQPITSHVSIAGGAGIFGTYFLPWFDRGDEVQGLGLEARPTWFARESHHGLYVAPYLRGVAVRGEVDGTEGKGFGFTAGAFVGWAFGLTTKLDLRLGLGAQYIYFDAKPADASTPFLAADILLGYRL